VTFDESNNRTLGNCSYLYGLPPIGIGSGWVESLTGYLARLSHEHGVYPVLMASSVLLPRLDKPYLPGHAKIGGTFWKKTVAINGTGTWAQDFVTLLEQLTSRADLRCLTMLSWNAILSPRGLLRRSKAWCPLCFASWYASGRVVYEPLIWTLDVIRQCPLHRYPLHTQCPYDDCARSLPALATRVRPGYCSTCHRWLGVRPMNERNQENGFRNAEYKQQLKLSPHVERMISVKPGMELPFERANLTATLTFYKEAYFHGDVISFARYVGISRRSMEAILEEYQTPQLGTLLKLCERLGTTPTDLIRRGTTENPGVSRLSLKMAGTAEKRKQKKRQRKFDEEKLLCALQRILGSSDEPPPSMRQVGRQLGYDASHLHRHFPQVCGAISARYKAYIRERKQERVRSIRHEVRRVTHIISKEGQYPSYRRVRAALRKSRLMYEPEAIATWHNTLKDDGWEL
jgi:transcriptional regulator with XRE-family HTH domain